ncbi:GLUG motif-containing protein [Paenisporosarcina sp. NPDC076898]|uniref:GLUG motif-containing protein n=1 Tax=unclassified Paenisporosarcina TaxID=2642018 RepID=UPI003D0447E6
MLGAGTLASPFIIQTPADLNAVRNNLSAYYQLGNDIDMTGFGRFTTIGTNQSAQQFKGSFDGKGFKIIGLDIFNSSSGTITQYHYGGLFTYINNAVIKNLGIENIILINQRNYTGAIAGYALNSTIENCYSTGKVQGLGTTNTVGGLVGYLINNSQGYSVMRNCYSTATVSGSPSTFGTTGGLVGLLNGDSTLIGNSFGATTLEYFSEGYGNAIVGRFGATALQANLTNLKYDSEKVLNNNIINAIGLTKSQFGDSSNFANWDSSVWGFQAGSYPYLKIFGLPATPAQNITVTLNSHSGIAKQLLDVSKRVVRVNVSHSKHLNSFNALELIKNANVNSHIEQIVSNVVVLKNANVKSYQVTSYMDEIGSKITRVVTTQRILQSHVNPIDSVIVVDIPVRTEIPVFAEVFLLSSQSEVDYLLGQTLLADKHNQSATTKILNQSNLYTTENRTEMEVN